MVHSLTGDGSDPANAAAAAIAQHTGYAHLDVAVVTGSGWTGVVDALGEPHVTMKFSDLPGFPALSVDGHHVTTVQVGLKAQGSEQGSGPVLCELIGEPIKRSA